MDNYSITYIKKLILFLLVILSIQGYSQEYVEKNERVFGNSLIDSSSIKGVEYVFSDNIYKTFIDTANAYLTVQLRGLSKNGKYLKNSGHIIQYDMKKNYVLWTQEISYQYNYLKQIQNTLIFDFQNKSFSINNKTGENICDFHNDILFIDRHSNIALGYKYDAITETPKVLEGIDLSNCSVLWSRDVLSDYGWNDISYLNDSVLLIIAAGLRTINIKTGKGWDYEMNTGVIDYTGTIAANAAGIALGVLTGTYITTSKYKLIRDLVSNTIIDSSNIYFAAEDQLVKLNKKTGKVVWKYPFEKNLASNSTLYVNDSIVYMVNKGYAFVGNRQINYGLPFFAAFDKKTGEKVFLNYIKLDDAQILSEQILNDEIVFVFKNKILKYSMETGKIILEKSFPSESVGDLRYLISKNVYIYNNGDLISLSQNDSLKLYVCNNQGDIFAIDSNFYITQTLKKDDIRVCFYRNNEFKFFNKNNKTLIVNTNGKIICELETSSNSFIKGNVLYDYKDNTLITIDLFHLLQHHN